MLLTEKKSLSHVITRLEIQHRSNFYQAASILAGSNLQGHFKLSRGIVFDSGLLF